MEGKKEMAEAESTAIFAEATYIVGERIRASDASRAT